MFVSLLSPVEICFAFLEYKKQHFNIWQTRQTKYLYVNLSMNIDVKCSFWFHLFILFENKFLWLKFKFILLKTINFSCSIFKLDILLYYYVLYCIVLYVLLKTINFILQSIFNHFFIRIKSIESLYILYRLRVSYHRHLLCADFIYQ